MSQEGQTAHWLLLYLIPEGTEAKLSAPAEITFFQVLGTGVTLVGALATQTW